jgi:hypothetical protein
MKSQSINVFQHGEFLSYKESIFSNLIYMLKTSGIKIMAMKLCPEDASLDN